MLVGILYSKHNEMEDTVKIIVKQVAFSGNVHNEKNHIALHYNSTPAIREVLKVTFGEMEYFSDSVNHDTVVEIIFNNSMGWFFPSRELIDKLRPDLHRKVLHTRDGRKVGNAIVLSKGPQEIYHCLTDYGNPMKLNINEINEWFFIGEAATDDHKHYSHCDK